MYSKVSEEEIRKYFLQILNPANFSRKVAKFRPWMSCLLVEGVSRPLIAKRCFIQSRTKLGRKLSKKHFFLLNLDGPVALQNHETKMALFEFFCSHSRDNLPILGHPKTRSKTANAGLKRRRKTGRKKGETARKAVWGSRPTILYPSTPWYCGRGQRQRGGKMALALEERDGRGLLKWKKRSLHLCSSFAGVIASRAISWAQFPATGAAVFPVFCTSKAFIYTRWEKGPFLA